MRWLIGPLLALALVACDDNGPKAMDWYYMVGSNADTIWHTKANFYREGNPIHGSSNGVAGFVGPKALKAKDYRWRIGKGRSLYNQPVPDKVVIEWVSYHDKKRYGITFDLPNDLGKQMARQYRVKVKDRWRVEQRDNIALGMASGGYVEVYITDPDLKPDILLARGIAQEVPINPSREDPLDSQFKNAWAGFDKKFREAYQNYPTPSGMAWAPIMDSYRAAQPKTDTDPVN